MRDPWRLLGAMSLIVGPALWCAGLLLRSRIVSASGLRAAEADRLAREPFAAPAELAGYAAHPSLAVAGYGLFLAGVIVLVPAVIALARLVAPGAPRLAAWGGALIVLSLLARVYYAGVEHTAFSLVDTQGLQPATRAVMAGYVDASYGPWRIPVTASVGQYLGAVLLAVGAYRSGVFGTGRCLLLLWWATMWMGVLKAAHWSDVAAAAGLCVVFVPLGVRLWCGRWPVPQGAASAGRPLLRRILRW